MYDLDSFEIHVIEGDVSRVETEPRSGLDVPAGEILKLIPTLTGTSLSPSKFFAGVQDEEQGQAQAVDQREGSFSGDRRSSSWLHR